MVDTVVQIKTINQNGCLLNKKYPTNEWDFFIIHQDI
jgi:hypothetical protein